MCGQCGGCQDDAALLVPEILLYQWTHANGSRVERQPVVIRVDFHPVNVIRGRFIDHRCDHAFSFGQAPVKVAQAADDIFQCFQPVGVEFGRTFPISPARLPVISGSPPPLAPGDFHAIPARLCARSRQDTFLIGVRTGGLAFALVGDKLGQGIKKDNLFLQPPDQIGGAFDLLI